MAIKLKRLHKELTHVWSGIGHFHDSSRSLYGYKQYRIKTRDYYQGWEVYDGETQISNSNGFGFTFKEARQWLENYLDAKNKVEETLKEAGQYLENYLDDKNQGEE